LRMRKLRKLGKKKLDGRELAQLRSDDRSERAIYQFLIEHRTKDTRKRRGKRRRKKYQSIGLNYSSSLIIDRSPLPTRPPRARVERRESALY